MIFHPILNIFLSTMIHFAVFDTVILSSIIISPPMMIMESTESVGKELLISEYFSVFIVEVSFIKNILFPMASGGITPNDVFIMASGRFLERMVTFLRTESIRFVNSDDENFGPSGLSVSNAFWLDIFPNTFTFPRNPWEILLLTLNGITPIQRFQPLPTSVRFTGSYIVIYEPELR